MFRRWPKRRYAAHACIVFHRVLCSQNVFDVRAQMLRKVTDTEFFVLLCLYRSSQYINSHALTDCTDCVTVWMTLTLGGERCKVRQFWDIISVTERSFCRIFDSRYVEVRTRILQQTEILTISQSIRQTVHFHWEDQGNDWLLRDIWIYLGGFAESDLYKRNITRFSSF